VPLRNGSRIRTTEIQCDYLLRIAESRKVAESRDRLSFRAEAVRPQSRNRDRPDRGALYGGQSRFLVRPEGTRAAARLRSE